MMQYAARAEGIARGRQWLVRITQQDFGYDLRAWHDHLTETNAGGYKWSNKHRGYPKQIESILADADWQSDVAFAVAESLFERLTDRDLRQRRAIDLAQREWAGKTRPCPKCGAEFKSVGDRGQCTNCTHIFYASHPALGNVMWWLDFP